ARAAATPAASATTPTTGAAPAATTPTTGAAPAAPAAPAVAKPKPRPSAAAKTKAKPITGPTVSASGDSTYTLKSGQEGTVFKSLTVEGEDRIRLDFERPELKLDLDPAKA